MPPKASKRIRDEDTETETNTPKKRRTTVKLETTEVIARSSPRSAKTARKTLKEESDSEEEVLQPLNESATALKIKRVKSKVVVEKKSKSKPAKTKAEVTEGEDEDEQEGAEEQIVPKKRKTKEEKEAEAMPIAARTVIATLKHAMHIGAHVSGAGGLFATFLSLQFSLIILQAYTIPFKTVYISAAIRLPCS